jgi:ABC transport system ATP-binding/permease protein
MSLLTLNNAHLAFGHVPLLKATDLTIIESERIGLIGRNGTGKSSLIKIIAGLSQLDDGRKTTRSNLKVNIVTQEPEFGTAITVFEGVAQAYAKEIAVLKEYEALSENFTDSAEHADRLGVLQGLMESNGIWQLQNRVQEIILRCSLEPEMIISKLSGGQRKRAALARALVTEPDLLLLDEPTNHLDFSGIEWLENLLNEFTGTSFFITHDRQFLDRVATRIVELDRGTLRSYPGNFAAYQERKAFELHAEQQANERFDKLLAQEEIWIRKGVEARRTRNEGRVRRLQSLRGERQAS